MMPLPATSLEERQRRFREFDLMAYNIMELALLYTNLSPKTLRGVEKDIRMMMMPEARAEMLLYTDRIEISAHAQVHMSRDHWWCWWSEKKIVRKYLHVDVVFNPYGHGLSVWTDPKEPGGVVRFQ
jgi:hypothetical protein